jgi:hypothetical protein
MHCTAVEDGAKEVLTVTECCPLRAEQCFHEVINSDPDVNWHTVNKCLATTFDYAGLMSDGVVRVMPNGL